MKLPVLYKYTNTGSIQQWEIVVERNTFYTIEGLVNGKLTPSTPTVCYGKNKGRSNETTDEQQAFLEAKSRWQKKKDKGYSEILTAEKKFFEPMLAHEREKYEKLLFTVPTYVQPKLDGCRAIYNNGSLFTRNGKEIVSCPHIADREVLGDSIFDGELYNHQLKNDFDKIISLTRKTKPTQEDLDESAQKIEYWIYDQPGDAIFSVRIANIFIKRSDARYVIVPTYQVFSVDDIERYHAEFLRQGFEGTMIRMDLGPYENKRSKQLLKYKDFQDAEFKILDVVEGEGNRSGMAGKLICELPNKNKVGVSMTGTQEFMTQVLKDKNKIIGLKCTVKFFGYTPEGSLRFPTLKHIINYVPNNK